MIFKLETLKDVIGNNYVGIKVPTDIVKPFVNKLKYIIGDDYTIYVDNQQNRDKGHYHITVINVMDYNSLIKRYGPIEFLQRLDVIFNTDVDVSFEGVGTATKGDNKAYFIVVESDDLNIIRDSFGLPKHDFHTTIGFKDKDVFGVRKNIVLEESSRFKSYIETKNNLNFLENVTNWTFDGTPEFVSLTETILTVIVDNQLVQVGFIDGPNGSDELRVVTVSENG